MVLRSRVPSHESPYTWKASEFLGGHCCRRPHNMDERDPCIDIPLYAAEWGLTTFATTAIFAIYPVFVVLTLVIFGNVSDFIGRRETMLLGLGV